MKFEAMRKYHILLSLLVIFTVLFLNGGELFTQKAIWVKGYYGSDGTHVRCH